MKRLGLLDDDGGSTYDGVHIHWGMVGLHVVRQSLLSTSASACTITVGSCQMVSTGMPLIASRHVVLYADFFRDGIA